MVFGLAGKVALITGGASGIGLRYAKELLRNGVKGVTLADINEKLGQIALKEIQEEFGENKAIFVKTDVSNLQQFEDAFKSTLEKFKNIDILINNAGLLNEPIWEKVVAVNVVGVIHGMILGMDNYLLKYKQESDAIIVNISSVAGIAAFSGIPVYSGTKFAVRGMSKCWGDPYHYERTKVRVVVFCPGATATTILNDLYSKTLGEPYSECMRRMRMKTQNIDHVGKEMIKVIKNSENGSVWVVEEENPAYEHNTS